MISSRLSFLVAAALLFPAAAAHAGPLTFNSITYSDETLTQGVTTLNSYSGGIYPATPVAMPASDGTYNDTGYNYSTDFLALAQTYQSIGFDYQPDQQVSFAAFPYLQTTSGANATASATSSLQFRFTVSTPAFLAFTAGITPGLIPSPYFTTDGHFSISEISAGGVVLSTLISADYDSSNDPGQPGLLINQTLHFPAGIYLMSIDVTSAITADADGAAPGDPNVNIDSGFFFIIPEPATLALFAIGGLLITRGRSRHARA
ncbi:MAG: PEP-CTERM sorting domain-containing protein [Phycisphaeraceae bacterium]